MKAWLIEDNAGYPIAELLGDLFASAIECIVCRNIPGWNPEAILLNRQLYVPLKVSGLPW